jgi:hypothetical protein
MPGPDLAEAAVPDLAPPPGDDLAPVDDLAPPPDLVPACLTEGSACTLPSGALGICKSPGVGQPLGCSGCGSPTSANDGACVAAYGPSVAYLCENDTCVRGDCRTSSDCSAGRVCVNRFCSPCTGATTADGDALCKGDPRYGASTLCLGGLCSIADCRTDGDCLVAGTTKTRLCGAVEANKCGGCTSDAQCQGSSDTTGSAGPSSMCEISTGACIPRSCTAGGNSYCTTANPADVCCGGTCQAGNCCGTGGGLSCVSGGCSSTDATKAGVCTTCEAAANNTYYVDPVNGSDETGTGNNSAVASCALKTVRRALQLIGAPAVATKIIVVGDSTVALRPAPEELYPIVLPSNIEIAAQTGPIQINDRDGFRIEGKEVIIRGFKIATAVSRSYGVEVRANASVRLRALEVSGFNGAGVIVKDGSIVLEDGVVVKNNIGDGMIVAGPQGKAVVDLRTTATASGVRFEGNGGYGIGVFDRARLSLSGNGNATTPTVAIVNNVKGGIRVDPRAIGELRGIVVTGSRMGSGIDVYPETLLRLSESTVLGNKFGVSVNPAGTLTNIGNILLDEANTFQVLPGGPIAPNSVVGICVNAGHVPLGMTATKLSARHNIFAGPRDCRTASPGGLSSLTACSGTRSDVAVVKLPNLVSPQLFVDNCTY